MKKKCIAWLLIIYGIFLFFTCKHTDKQEEEAPIFLLDSTYVSVNIVASHLDVPWEITSGPDDEIWFTEQSGKVNKIDAKSGHIKTLLTLPNLYRERTAGLLGMVTHPNMSETPYVFIAYSARKSDQVHVSRVVRYTYEADTLVHPLTILEYPAWKGHFGARVAIAPDGKLIIATGDGAQNENAQNLASPNGKILRFNIDGSIPSDNPFPNNAVWAWGLRNPQGLVFSSKGILYNSDHGDATDDEVNIIQRGGNYGWPKIAGYVDSQEERLFAQDSILAPPLHAWTPTIAPAGLAYYASAEIPEWKNTLLLATLKGNSLYALPLNKEGTKADTVYHFFERTFGRIRAVYASPDGTVYMATSNRDWNPNGFAEENDDRILQIKKVDKSISTANLVLKAKIASNTKEMRSEGEILYTNYCASCHKPNGRGLTGTYPSLLHNKIVEGETAEFIRLILHGKNEMPSFSFLNDKDLAIVLSYVRKKFASKGRQISKDDIKKERVNR
ncbi:PQQ-dependent sugar dehydrogenase [Olivibacter jilunii]|uniref:PQQ-dependent sugar dehydrogenase n=1 Tax=Olivibacter jilunii TaxID=985016 RepID=UPI003F178E15